MQVKKLHGMMTIFQLCKNYEGQNIVTCTFFGILFKIHWKKWKSFHWFGQALNHIFLDMYGISVVFFSPIFSDFPP